MARCGRLLVFWLAFSLVPTPFAEPLARWGLARSGEGVAFAAGLVPRLA